MMSHVKALVGKTVIVTGASRGLGADIARAVWRNGAHLLLAARSEEALVTLRAELMATATDGQQAHVVVADLRTADAVPKIMAESHRAWKTVDVLVNNAAIVGPIGKAWENDWEEWQATIRVNLLAVFELCRACLPWMIERRQGKIINLSGGGAAGTRPNFSAYATAKAGLVRFSEILAQELRDLNIQVNCVSPGAMRTEMLQAVLNAGLEKAGRLEYAQAVEKATQGGALPQQAAALCVFLASSASDGITGKLISAVWDPWEKLSEHIEDLKDSDIYTLRRIVPKDRGKDWG
jgi:3-oxoacyl-[acyl-carrier protein] reductase